MSECTRSHPHEEMDETCELRTVIARQGNELTTLRARVQELEAKVPKWVSVHDRLPKYGDPALLNIKGVVQHAIYTLGESDETTDWWECMADDSITMWWHQADEWMPLPTPPEDSSDE